MSQPSTARPAPEGQKSRVLPVSSSEQPSLVHCPAKAKSPSATLALQTSCRAHLLWEPTIKRGLSTFGTLTLQRMGQKSFRGTMRHRDAPCALPPLTPSPQLGPVLLGALLPFHVPRLPDFPHFSSLAGGALSKAVSAVPPSGLRHESQAPSEALLPSLLLQPGPTLVSSPPGHTANRVGRRASQHNGRPGAGHRAEELGALSPWVFPHTSTTPRLLRSSPRHSQVPPAFSPARESPRCFPPREDV